MTAVKKVLPIRETIESKLVNLARECLVERDREEVSHSRYTRLTELAKKLIRLATVEEP